MQEENAPQDTERYAVYFRPDEQDELTLKADRWLGRSPFTGTAFETPPLPDLDPALWRRWTEAPRRYGFHATLKPPVRLAPPHLPEDFERAVSALASSCPPFRTKPLILKNIGSFLALGLSAPDESIDGLAADCVRRLDGFRAAASHAELAKRRAVGLTSNQENMLALWGYPYVLTEFRFHMTLTGSLPAEELAHAQSCLETYFDGLLGQTLSVNSVCLFEQTSAGAAFQLRRRLSMKNFG